MKFFLKKSVSVTLFTVLLVLFVGIIWVNNQQEKHQEKKLSELQKQAAPYEQEIQEIRDDIDRKYREIYNNTDTAGVIVGFLATSEDIELVKTLTDGYDFIPAILLNCTQDKAELEKIAKKTQEENFQIFFTSDSFDSATLNNVSTIKEDTQGTEFLLTKSYDTEENWKILKEYGYQNIFRYSRELDSESKDGMLYLPYGIIRKNVFYSELLDSVTSAHVNIATVFNLENLRENKLQEKTITEYLELLDKRVGEGTLQCVSVSEAFWTMAQKEKSSEDIKNEYENYVKDKEARIEEIETQIHEIYSHWKE